MVYMAQTITASSHAMANISWLLFFFILLSAENIYTNLLSRFCVRTSLARNPNPIGMLAAHAVCCGKYRHTMKIQKQKYILQHTHKEEIYVKLFVLLSHSGILNKHTFTYMLE